MTEWKPIESAPKDGTRQWVKRVYEGRIVKEGWAVFGLPAADAPMRSALGTDPLRRLSARDYALEAETRQRMVEQPRWLNEDRMYYFPEPTHWCPPALPNAPTP